LLPISENPTLFQLIGTTYGGDGQNTFALPNLQSRIPIHVGAGYSLGQSGGVESVTLTVNQIPAHSHSVLASSNNATQSAATGRVLATTPSYTPYISDSTSVTMAAQSIGSAGSSQPHDNMQPFLCVNFILSLFGVFPSQN